MCPTQRQFLILYSSSFWSLVVIQGSSLKYLAEKLGVKVDKKSSIKEGANTVDLDYLENNMFEMTITESSPFVNKTVSELVMPYEILVTLIKSNGLYIHPKGNTLLKLGDQITIMCREKENLLKYISKRDPSALT